MEDFQNAEENAFVVDDVSNVVKEATERDVDGDTYRHSKVNQWAASVVEQALSQITKLGKPLQYIVTCVIMQNRITQASSCFWNSSPDGCCTGDGRTKTMCCIISAFRLST
ncbi:dynein light chain Tctex-type 1-like [Sturnira hondurensis]|uniref:dynein light chain Tctex-type 1-like n=1 Tax=Sturnira hondurensis TaxID=192404 RepID=UPI00187ACC9D|nr:dynein light chain Tctex-type 1-like [Sturnira hondurensis]